VCKRNILHPPSSVFQVFQTTEQNRFYQTSICTWRP